ncbi:hypothetical protein B0I35DRAFT_420312 [Stachybotrys elegans]|uniref:Uncharacterized protein n=1 Tax=Stachybotrys elegans TaxID=80388 RepID=A0A8K0T3E6_9HYPO|nr:hypothetical protein B0I35DRAFT_420312 [Stachybotrys elegans]
MTPFNVSQTREQGLNNHRLISYFRHFAFFSPQSAHRRCPPRPPELAAAECRSEPPLCTMVPPHAYLIVRRIRMHSWFIVPPRDPSPNWTTSAFPAQIGISRTLRHSTRRTSTILCGKSFVPGRPHDANTDTGIHACLEPHHAGPRHDQTIVLEPTFPGICICIYVYA